MPPLRGKMTALQLRCLMGPENCVGYSHLILVRKRVGGDASARAWPPAWGFHYWKCHHFLTVKDDKNLIFDLVKDGHRANAGKRAPSCVPPAGDDQPKRGGQPAGRRRAASAAADRQTAVTVRVALRSPGSVLPPTRAAHQGRTFKLGTPLRAFHDKKCARPWAQGV